MSLKDDVPELIEYWKCNNETLKHNTKLFEVSEGNLLPQVLEDLKKQLSADSYDKIVSRVPPINMLIRIVEKLSKIYVKPPARTIMNGKKKDQKSLGELIRVSDFNAQMTQANLFFNTFKNTWVEPYLYQGIPRLRAIPSDRFFVYSEDKVDPTSPTHFVKIMGKDVTSQKTTFYAYTKDEFLVFNSEKEILTAQMAKIGNPNGVNEYKCLPGVYINRSRHCLVPQIDSDLLSMTKLVPVLLADCAFAIMFQAFSIMYGIDVDDQNLKMAPNVFWRFKSDPTKETKPEVGIIKPELDTDKVLSFVKAIVSMWLESRGIKPGSLGSLTVENAASGIAKMIDESDTSEDRKKQATIFSTKDAELLQIMINNMIPVWSKEPGFSLEASFYGNNYRINSEFPEQQPVLDENAAADAEIKKLGAGLTTKKRSIKALNPDMTDEQIDELIVEIALEKPAPKPDEKIPPVGSKAS